MGSLCKTDKLRKSKTIEENDLNNNEIEVIKKKKLTRGRTIEMGETHLNMHAVCKKDSCERTSSQESGKCSIGGYDVDEEDTDEIKQKFLLRLTLSNMSCVPSDMQTFDIDVGENDVCTASADSVTSMSHVNGKNLIVYCYECSLFLAKKFATRKEKLDNLIL